MTTKKSKTYSVLVYPTPVEYEIVAKSKQEAEQNAIDLYTPNSMDVYKTVSTIIK